MTAGRWLNKMDTKDEQLSIPLSKGKIVLLTLGSVAFVALGFWIWSIADSQTRYPPEFAKIFSVSGILFFGFCGVYGVVKLFDTKPGLIISQRGVFDNSSAVNAGWIEWEDIYGFEVSQIQLTKFLVIVVEDPSKYLKGMNPLKKVMMKMNSGMVGSPITISSNSLSCDFAELREILEANFLKYSSQQGDAHNSGGSSSIVKS